MSRVTALIPCYNAERYLAEAIASVRAQTRPVDEILVIDDRSTDRSRDVARAAGATVVALEKNSGPSAARNAGLRVAEGDLVAFLDADDIWTATHCEIVVGLLEQAPNAVLGFGRSACVEFPRVVSSAAIPAGVPVDALEPMLRENLVTQSAAVLRREVALEVGAYDTTMRHAEDYDLWLRLALVGPYVCTHDVTCWRHVHDAQASTNVAAMRSGAWRARSHALDALKLGEDDRRFRSAWTAAVAGWQVELRDSWFGETPLGLDATLAIRRDYGLPAAPYWTWMLHRHVLWQPRQLARYIWRRARGRAAPPLVAVQ